MYDAPETAAGIVSPAGDVWSIGVTLVAALTQNVAFEGETLRGDPDPPETVPQPFRGIARECLHLDPKRRCSITEIQARLQPAARSVPAEPEAPLPQRRPSKRGPIAAALLAGVLLVGLIIYFSRGKSEPSQDSATTEQHAAQTAPQPSSQTAPQTVAPRAAPQSAPTAAPKPAGNSASRRTEEVVASGGEVLHQVLPDVSKSAQNTISGTVKVGVRVEVDPSGKVTTAKLTSPGPSRYFAGLALKAAQRWEFSPPVADGAPTASTWLIQFRFKRTSTQAVPATSNTLGFARLAQLPHNLPHHPQQQLRVVGFQPEAQDQPAGLLLEHGVRPRLHITTDAKRFQQSLGDLLGLTRRCELDLFFRGWKRRTSSQFVETDRDGLPQIH